jgi:hypothetical protein
MPINEVAVTAVIATPELISPGDATEAGADGLELVEGPDQRFRSWPWQIAGRVRCWKGGGDIGSSDGDQHGEGRD